MATKKLSTNKVKIKTPDGKTHTVLTDRGGAYDKYISQGGIISSGQPKDTPKKTPTGSLSSNTSEYDAGTSGTPYGASGRGEFLDNPEYNAEQEAIIKSGAPMSTGSDYKTYVAPKLSSSEALELAEKYGLKGMGLDKQLKGLTQSEAMAKALQFGKERQGQTSALTSYTFNPQSISGFKKGYDDMKFKLDETNNDPWLTRQEKKQKNKAITESYSDQFSKLFDNPEQFNAAMQDPSFAKMLKDYERKGGDVNSITSKIGQGVTVTGYQDNADGTTTNTLSDGTQETGRLRMNADGTYTFDQGGPQSLTEYLGGINTPSQKKALESLIPEQKITQDEIAFNQSIPEQYKAMYFGTPEQTGLVQQKRQQALEEIKLIERKSKMDEKNARAQVDYAIEKNNAEMEVEEAQIEENRLAAKNYMTGMLAKLGALNTTSSAPIAITNLETKYQQQSQKLRTSYRFANEEMKLKLNEEVDRIGLERDTEILATKADLSKSEEDVWKEIFKLQNAADTKTFSILSRYAKDFRTQTEKYTKEAKAAAEKYAKEFAKAVTTYDIDGVMEGGYVTKRDSKGKKNGGGILDPEGNIREISDILKANRGADTFVNPKVYDEMYKAFVKAGGTIQEFKKQFPPVDYIKPNETYALPTSLKYEKPSQTESKKKDTGREA